jgi:transcriptional regulator with XRE-family HTH domain
MANYLFFQPSLVEYFAKQKMGSISKLLEAVNKDGSWWYRSKAKTTIKLHDVERLANALGMHPGEFYTTSESENVVQETVALYTSENSAISSRITQLVQIKAENNQSTFSEMIGITKGQVSNILNKKHAPGFHTLSKIIRAFPDISARWLLTGEGSVVSNEREDQSLRELVKSKDEIIGLLKSQLADLKKQ